jgi:NAD(P)H dehydrogenase (quinone)
VSFGEIAEMLSNITGKEVKYHKPDLGTYIETLAAAGVPKEIASFLGGFGTAIGEGEFDTHRSDLKKLLGRNPMELEEFLRITYSK